MGTSDGYIIKSRMRDCNREAKAIGLCGLTPPAMTFPPDREGRTTGPLQHQPQHGLAIVYLAGAHKTETFVETERSAVRLDATGGQFSRAGS